MQSMKIHGIILVSSFGCGPDSLTNELVDIEAKKNNFPLMILIIDEHSGEVGLNTRLEAFVEMLRGRGCFGENNLSSYGKYEYSGKSHV